MIILHAYNESWLEESIEEGRYYARSFSSDDQVRTVHSATGAVEVRDRHGELVRVLVVVRQ